MTDIDERGRSGRFGAATPGARRDRASLEELLAPQPVRRRPTWRQLVAIVVVLAAAGGGYAAGHLLGPSGPPPMVRLVLTGAALPQGASLSQADLRVVTVPATAAPPGALSPSAVSAASGMVTSEALPADAFVTRSELTTRGALPSSSQAEVGLDLKPGEMPAGGLTAGEHVMVVALRQTPQGAAETPLSLLSTTVWSVSGPDSSGGVQATVLVPRSLATTLAGYAASGEVALVSVG